MNKMTLFFFLQECFAQEPQRQRECPDASYQSGSAQFTYFSSFPTLIRLMLYVLVFIELMGGLHQNAFASPLLQDFDVLGKGTSYVSIQSNNPPGPAVLPGGPTGTGNFLRLVSAVPQPSPPSSNTITFPTTNLAADVIVIDFDFRLTPGNAVTPWMGRADGFGAALLNAAIYPMPGVTPQYPLYAPEEPNFTGSLGIGFDIYKNPAFDKYPADIGSDDVIRYGFSDSLSVHFNKELLTQVDLMNVVDLAVGLWIHARIIARPGGGFSDVSVILTPKDGKPVTVVNNLKIPGLLPYRGRLHFGARSGGESAHADLDNISAQFLSSTQSLLSLESVTTRVEETGRSAVLTIDRVGNLADTVQVGYCTTDDTAKSGLDYLGTPCSSNSQAQSQSYARGLSQALTFFPTETRKSFTIPIINNAQEEGDKTFFVSLQDLNKTSAPPLPRPGGQRPLIGETAVTPSSVISPAQSLVTIFDDEHSRLVGHWDGVRYWPIVAVHMHLLPTGNVMFWDRLGNSRLWDPTTEELRTPAVNTDDLFCSGHSFLADGQLLVTGGVHAHGAYAFDGLGLVSASLYQADTNTWTKLSAMNAGRWYPTNTTLANGEVLVTSGTTDVAYTKNLLSQVWQPATQTWRDLVNAQAQSVNGQALGIDLYPRMFVAPDGRVFKAGPDPDSWFLDTANGGNWTAGPLTHWRVVRSYGTAAMYEPGKILIAGGGDPADGDTNDDETATAEVINLNDANPAWRTVASMNFARRHLNGALLPDGSILVIGGVAGEGFDNESRPVFAAELWNPVSETWTLLPSAQSIRGYHSTALLLPDGRVLTAGGGQGGGAVGNHTESEIYFPPYLFKGPRPVINAVPLTLNYSDTFVVQTPNAASIAKVSLIRLPSVTHAFDQNQRFLSLDFTPGSGSLTVSAPVSANLAPPGHYMLFIVNTDGVPSIAKIIAIGSPAPQTRPVRSLPGASGEIRQQVIGRPELSTRTK